MPRGMLLVPGVVRRLVPALAAAAVVAVPLLPATASAQEPAGSTVRGELVQAWPEVAHDSAAGQAEAAGPITWVETEGGESVRIPTEDAAGLTVGSTVQVTVGAEVGAPPTAEGLEPARTLLGAEVLAAEQRVPVVSNRVTVALVAPRGVAHDAVRPEQVAAAVDGPVARFWSEQTDGAVKLDVVETHDWVDTTVGCRSPGRLWDQAAREVGFTAGPGKHLLLYLSSAAPENCAYGLAEVGSDISSGGRVYVRDAPPAPRPAAATRPPTATCTTSWVPPGRRSARSTPSRRPRWASSTAPPGARCGPTVRRPTSSWPRCRARTASGPSAWSGTTAASTGWSCGRRPGRTGGWVPEPTSSASRTASWSAGSE